MLPFRPRLLLLLLVVEKTRLDTKLEREYQYFGEEVKEMRDRREGVVREKKEEKEGLNDGGGGLEVECVKRS